MYTYIFNNKLETKEKQNIINAISTNMDSFKNDKNAIFINDLYFIAIKKDTYFYISKI